MARTTDLAFWLLAACAPPSGGGGRRIHSGADRAGRHPADHPHHADPQPNADRTGAGVVP